MSVFYSLREIIVDKAFINLDYTCRVIDKVLARPLSNKGTIWFGADFFNVILGTFRLIFLNWTNATLLTV